MIFQLLWLFLAYSFIGWILETTAAAIKHRYFSNRGIINGPFCVIYGFGGCFVTIFTQDLNGSWLFLGSAIVSTLVEWIAGHLIEKWYHERWWDYSSRKWHLDGYISLFTSCFWGLLGIFTVRVLNPFLLKLYSFPSVLIREILITALIVLLTLDAAATLIVLSGRSKNAAFWLETDERLDSVSRKLRTKISRFIDARLGRAYPQKTKTKVEPAHPEIFAYGCSFYKIVMLFFIGAFLGDITETIFCRITAGIWMSRSSVVWGPFSIVWGLAIAAATALLYKHRNRSDSFLFCMGTFLGGAYEYICSVFTEIAFGTVFWDYSEIPFNLGGRINLLYCFFWGIAAVVWFKMLYPRFSALIERIPKRIGKCVTWILIVFMIVNIIISCAALGRCGSRKQGEAARNNFEEWIDNEFDDARMEQIYPNAIGVE